MTDLVETELRRARWRRALERHALELADRDDFALGGLTRRLRTPTAQLLLLPADPEDEILHLDDTLWEWLEAHKTAKLGGRLVRFGDQKCPTAHAAALVNSYGGSAPWNNYLALYRSGAIESGLGNRGGREREGQEGTPFRVFNLISIVTYTWAMLNFSAMLSERVELAGPMHLTVALRGTGDALLGNVGEGWAEPGSWENDVGGCHDENLLWHVSFDGPLDEDAQQRVALEVGDRIEDAWGVSQRRYLARLGDRAGQLDLRNVAE